MNRAIVSAAGALTSVVLMFSGGTAHADKASVDDPVGDVWQTPNLAGGADWQETGTRGNVDIDGSVFRHTPQNVIATIAFKDLRKQGDDRHVAGLLIRTDEGREYVVGVESGAGRWAGLMAAHHVNPPPVEGETESRAVLVDCGASPEFDYRADTLTIRLPRSCLGDPEWIRSMSAAESHTENGTSFRDHGHNTGHDYRGWTRRLYAG